MARFVDRDMIMRFYWGLGVGHIYSHKDTITVSPSEDEIMESEDEDETVETTGSIKPAEVQDIDEDEYDEGHEEITRTAEECLGLNAREDEGWEDPDGDSTEGSEDSSSDGGSGYGGMDSTNLN